MGYKVLGQIDRERYTDLSHEGLEGPFMFESGKILYYDKAEESIMIAILTSMWITKKCGIFTMD